MPAGSDWPLGRYTSILLLRIFDTGMEDDSGRPEKLYRKLTDGEKERIRKRILKLEREEMEQSVAQILADEFDCSPSQIAGIMGHMRSS